MNWSELFSFDVSPAELFFRASVMYLALFVLLRVTLKRQASATSLTDLLVLVLMAEAAGNIISADSKSLAGGILMVSTILFWSFTLDLVAYRIPAIGRLVSAPPLQLIKDGRLLRRNMRKELITQEELISLLRRRGVETLDEVKVAYMEGDGEISVITRQGQTSQADDSRRARI